VFLNFGSSTCFCLNQLSEVKGLCGRRTRQTFLMGLHRSGFDPILIRDIKHLRRLQGPAASQVAVRHDKCIEDAAVRVFFHRRSRKRAPLYAFGSENRADSYNFEVLRGITGSIKFDDHDQTLHAAIARAEKPDRPNVSFSIEASMVDRKIARDCRRWLSLPLHCICCCDLRSGTLRFATFRLLIILVVPACPC